MHGVATEKVPGGKLLRVKVEYGETIDRVQLTGDFFLYPEDELSVIEEALVGLRTDEPAETIAEVVAGIVAQHNIELVGITPEAIAQTLKKAMSE